MAKPAKRAGGIGSSTTQTPITNWIIGVRYWRRPIVLSGMRLAAAPNMSSGTAVITPVPMSSAVVAVEWWNRTSAPDTCSTTR